ncbi:MAG: hypothetical protein E6Q66_06645 [Pedobacter sp.]|nr:MAG: hypothetical protein E6Q66_06645 [Pedobacter sp.]
MRLDIEVLNVQELDIHEMTTHNGGSVVMIASAVAQIVLSVVSFTIMCTVICAVGNKVLGWMGCGPAKT